MANKEPSKKKQPELTVSKLLKKAQKNKTAPKDKQPKSKHDRNLPSTVLRREESNRLELSENNYITEEEAFGPEVQNEAYLTIAKRYRLLRWGVVALLVLFLFAMFNFFREDITVDNFRYLMRNVNFEIKSEIDEAGSILYDSDDQNAFALYKSSLAVANSRKLTIYDAGGRSSCTAEFDYAAPALLSSDKYVLAYDRTDGDYSLYSTFSQMHTDSTGYPISDADLTDDGVFAIASRSKDYFGVVTIYNSSFKMLGKIQKSKYIASIDLSADGKSIVIASYYSGERGYVTELMTLKVDSDEPELLFTVENTFPYRVSWTAEGEFMLASSSGITFFDKDGKIYNEYIFSEQNVIKYNVNEYGAAIVMASPSDADRSTLVLLDPKGKELGHYTLDGTVSSLTCSDGTVCLVSGMTAWKIEEGVLYRADTDHRLMTALTGENEWLCSYTQVLTPDWKESKN